MIKRNAQCPICATEFVAVGKASSHKKYCSPVCVTAAATIQARERRKIKPYVSQAKSQSRKCARCDHPFTVVGRAAARQRYCSPWCYKAAKFERRNPRQLKLKCAHCGIDFVRTVQQKYCSHGCNKAAAIMRHMPKPKPMPTTIAADKVRETYLASPPDARCEYLLLHLLKRDAKSWKKHYRQTNEGGGDEHDFAEAAE